MCPFSGGYSSLSARKIHLCTTGSPWKITMGFAPKSRFLRNNLSPWAAGCPEASVNLVAKGQGAAIHCVINHKISLYKLYKPVSGKGSDISKRLRDTPEGRAEACRNSTFVPGTATRCASVKLENIQGRMTWPSNVLSSMRYWSIHLKTIATFINQAAIGGSE